MTRAEQALSAIKEKEGNSRGFFVHGRHKDVVIAALEYFINSFDTAKR